MYDWGAYSTDEETAISGPNSRYDDKSQANAKAVTINCLLRVLLGIKIII